MEQKLPHQVGIKTILLAQFITSNKPVLTGKYVVFDYA